MSDLDREQESVLLFLEQRGRVCWGDVRVMTVMTTGTMVGLVTRGLVSADPLGDERELVDETELALTEAGKAFVLSLPSEADPEETVAVSAGQTCLF